MTIRKIKQIDYDNPSCARCGIVPRARKDGQIKWVDWCVDNIAFYLCPKCSKYLEKCIKEYVLGQSLTVS